MAHVKFKAAASVWASPVVSVEAGQTVAVRRLHTDVWTAGGHWLATTPNVYEYDAVEVSPRTAHQVRAVRGRE